VRVLLVGNHWTPGPGGAETMLAARVRQQRLRHDPHRHIDAVLLAYRAAADRERLRRVR
jgi:hypothetical protein